MASRVGHSLSGANPELMLVDVCARALQVLQSETQLYKRSLALAPTEPPFIALTRAGDRVGDILAPNCPPASSCSIYCLQKRVKAGRAPPADIICGGLYATVLATLAALVLVSAELQQPDDLCVALAELPAAYEVSITHGGVRITLPVPASAPEGSRVVISRVSVAGCDVALGEAPLQVIVGFNHAPAPAGPVIDSVRRGDVPALMRLLDGGASAEEKDRVSGTMRR
jgi:hypothetical protein